MPFTLDPNAQDQPEAVQEAQALGEGSGAALKAIGGFVNKNLELDENQMLQFGLLSALSGGPDMRALSALGGRIRPPVANEGGPAISRAVGQREPSVQTYELPRTPRSLNKWGTQGKANTNTTDSYRESMYADGARRFLSMPDLDMRTPFYHPELLKVAREVSAKTDDPAERSFGVLVDMIKRYTGIKTVEPASSMYRKAMINASGLKFVE